jgi:hypothetical protein
MSGAASQACSFKYRLQVGKQPCETVLEYPPEDHFAGQTIDHN